MAAKAKPLARDAVLARAATFRALIRSAIHKTPGITQVQLATALADALKEHKASGNVITGQLTYLRQSGEVVPVRKGLQFHYYVQGATPEDEPGEVSLKKPLKTPSIQIDVIKSTGRVRLQIQGLVIEIGVTDK